MFAQYLDQQEVLTWREYKIFSYFWLQQVMMKSTKKTVPVKFDFSFNFWDIPDIF